LVSYVFSSTKLENKRAKQVLPGSDEGIRREVGVGNGVAGMGREGPNNVYTYE
jgi:hypothetical protein